MQVSGQKRLSSNVSFSAAYTLSRTVEELAFRDEIARIIDRSPSPTDRPHRVTISAVYTSPPLQGPIGRLFGDWTVGGIFIGQTGRPWNLPANVWYVENARLELDRESRYLQRAAPCVAQGTTSGEAALLPYSRAWGCTRPNFIIRPPFMGRTTALRDAGLRNPGFRQVDVAVARTMNVGGQLRLQVRAEVFNLLNEPAYDEVQYTSDPFSSSFGQIDRDAVAQSNFPRHVQLAVKLLF